MVASKTDPRQSSSLYDGDDTVEDRVAWSVDNPDIFYGLGCPLVPAIFEFPFPFRPVGIFVYIVSHD